MHLNIPADYTVISASKKMCAFYSSRVYNTEPMKLPKLHDSQKYTGLYIFDFGDHTGVGFTAEEVAELLESEKYKNCKVYKIHRAYPDGKLELKGVPAQTFQLEAGMFFYSQDIETSKEDFRKLTDLADKASVPCRAKVHMSKYNNEKYVVALIYPAEYDDEFSSWLLDGQYKTDSAVEGGIDAVQRYYDTKPEILDRYQMFGESKLISRTGEELMAGLKSAVQR